MTKVGEFAASVDAARSERAERERTRMRELANTLLSFGPFVDWAGDAMRDHSYFGEGRELTPYQQGLRGGVVRLFERLVEAADDGDAFLARVFREKIVGGAGKGEKR